MTPISRTTVRFGPNHMHEKLVTITCVLLTELAFLALVWGMIYLAGSATGLGLKMIVLLLGGLICSIPIVFIIDALSERR